MYLERKLKKNLKDEENIMWQVMRSWSCRECSWVDQMSKLKAESVLGYGAILLLTSPSWPAWQIPQVDTNLPSISPSLIPFLPSMTLPAVQIPSSKVFPECQLHQPKWCPTHQLFKGSKKSLDTYKGLLWDMPLPRLSHALPLFPLLLISLQYQLTSFCSHDFYKTPFLDSIKRNKMAQVFFKQISKHCFPETWAKGTFWKALSIVLSESIIFQSTFLDTA